MSTKELVISYIEAAMKQIEDSYYLYYLIEKGFTFLRQNKILSGEELKQNYEQFDERISNTQSAIARQIWGSTAEAILPNELAGMLGRKSTNTQEDEQV